MTDSLIGVRQAVAGRVLTVRGYQAGGCGVYGVQRFERAAKEPGLAVGVPAADAGSGALRIVGAGRETMRLGAVGWMVVGVVLGAGGVGYARAQQVQVSAANRTIAITTTENAERRADVASLHIGYHVYAADSAVAYAKAAEASQAIGASLGKLGVAKEAISSESQSTGESQEFRNSNLTPEQRAERRFEAQQSWTVKTTAEAVARVLAGAVSAGANTSGSVDWSVSDEASLSAEAGAKALVHAREIAAQMAKGLGAKIGNLIYASNEVEAIRPRIILGGKSGYGSGLGGGTGVSLLNLDAPMITRSATVSAIFAIE